MKYENIFFIIISMILFQPTVSSFAMDQPSVEEIMFFDMCKKGDIDGIKFLINDGFNINTKDFQKRTALILACEMGNRKLVQYLIENGANIFVRDSNNKLPRQIALERRYTNIVSYLDSAVKTSQDKNREPQAKHRVNQETLIPQKSSIQPQTTPKQNAKVKNKKQKKVAKNKQKKPIPLSNETQKQSTQSLQGKKTSKKQLLPTNPAVTHWRNDIVAEHSDNVGVIYDYSKQAGCCDEIVVFKNNDILSPGIYCHTPHGLELLVSNFRSNDGKLIQSDQLADLVYTEVVKDKMYSWHDIRHSFSTRLEQEFGQWARIIIDNSVHNLDQLCDSTKKFHLSITIPGQIYEVDYTSGQRVVTGKHFGVFEFKVRKNLYEKKGLCVHRFFAPKGSVGAYDFGAKARAKETARMYQH